MSLISDLNSKPLFFSKIFPVVIWKNGNQPVLTEMNRSLFILFRNVGWCY